MIKTLNNEDKRKIKQFIQKCESAVNKQNLVSCYLHGSATRNYGKHNDLDLFMLCVDTGTKSQLEAKFETPKKIFSDERPYLDINFSLTDDFMNACKKPVSDSYGSHLGGKIKRADDEFRIRIILSIIHGIPIYRIKKGCEILKRAKNYLKEHYGAEKFDEIMNWWEKKYNKS